MVQANLHLTNSLSILSTYLDRYHILDLIFKSDESLNIMLSLRFTL